MEANRKALLIYDVFNGQTTNLVTAALQRNNILPKKVPNNHTDIFQPLELTVNKPSKTFVSNKYQDWHAQEVSAQLQRNVNPHDGKMGVNLSTVKPLHARWIVYFYKEMQLQTSKSIIEKGFKKGHIRDAVDRADALQTCSDNPFLEIDIELS